MKQDEETFTGNEKLEQQSLPFPAFRTILIAAWFGLLTGLIEAVFLIGWRQYYRQNIIHLSPHGLWMAPVTEMFIFILPGVSLTLLVWLLPRFFTIRTATFILSLLSFFALLLLFPQIHIYVKWILAMGLAVQTSRIIHKYQTGFYQLVRRTAPLLIVVVIGLVLGTFIREGLVERQSLAKLPTPASTTPNVIIVTLDTVRAQSLSLYGYERRTSPQLERIAQESAVFEQAIATSSWTLPSHASIFTGRFPHEMNVSWTKPLNSTYPTLAEELGHRGYDTAGFAANFSFCTKANGLNRGMIHYEDYPVSLGQMFLSSTLGQKIANTGFIRRSIGYHDMLNRKSAEVLNEDFLNWLSSREQNRPFFAFLNYFDAHEPLLPPAPFDKLFEPTNPKGDFRYLTNDIDLSNKHDWSEPDVVKYRNDYENSIAYLDDQLGMLFKQLAEKGILENTVVIITSDHGESVGEHGLFGHGNSLYIETLQVPLLIRFPSLIPKGVRIEQPVSLRDLPTSVLDLIGETKGNNSFSGQSLKRYWDKVPDQLNTNTNPMIFSELVGANWLDSWYPASKGEMKSLITDSYHYIWNENGNEELYNLKTDPKELHNLAQSVEEQKTIAEFRSELKKMTDLK